MCQNICWPSLIRLPITTIWWSLQRKFWRTKIYSWWRNFHVYRFRRRVWSSQNFWYWDVQWCFTWGSWLSCPFGYRTWDSWLCCFDSWWFLFYVPQCYFCVLHYIFCWFCHICSWITWTKTLALTEPQNRPRKVFFQTQIPWP